MTEAGAAKIPLARRGISLHTYLRAYVPVFFRATKRFDCPVLQL